jgi:hypothetical protein
MTERFPVSYHPHTLAWVGILLVLPALAACVLWGLWALTMYLLRSAPEEPAPPDEKVRNWEAAFRHHGYRVSFGVFAYSLFLFAACSCGVLLGRLLVTSQSGAPTFIPPAHPGSLAAFAVLLPFSAALGLASLLTVAHAAQYGAGLPHTSILRALWLIYGGIACGEGAALSAWLYPSAAIWAVWATLGAILLPLGIWAILSRDETGVTTLAAAGEGAHLVRAVIARELIDQGLAAEGRYRGESPWLYWGRVAGASLLPVLFFWMVGSFFFGAVLQSANTRPSPSDLLSFGLFAGCLFGGLVFLAGRWSARSVDWDSTGATVTWYCGPEARFAWEDIARVSPGAVGEARTPTLLVRTREGHKFAILANRPGYAQLRDVLVAYAYRQND